MSEEWKYDESSGSFRRSETQGQSEYHYRYTPQRSGDGGSDWFSWVLIGLFFLSGWGWWIGLILLINKLKDDKRHTVRHTYSSTRAATASSVTPQERTSGVRRTEQRTAARETSAKVTNAAKKVTRSPNDTDKSARVLRIIGAILAAFGALGLVTELGNIFSGAIDWSGLFYSVGFLSGGGVMFGKGLQMQRRRSRIARYRAFMGDRDFVTVEELMMITGKKRGVVEKDVDYMLQKGMFETGAFFDAGHGILFRSADAYQHYLQERTKKEDLTPQEAKEGYSGALRAIREANDRIPDPVFSEKLDRMEEIAGKIFKEVEAHPEKQKQASTFFDYYLPTTLKLLSTYTEFEEAGIEGENLRQAKARIESIMDTLLENFEKQLDDLYRSEAMDVDADIRVMENMLNRDLSSVERDFGLNLDGGTAVQSKPD